MDRAFQSMRVEPVTTCIPPDGEERLSQEERSSSFFCCYWRTLIAYVALLPERFAVL